MQIRSASACETKPYTPPHTHWHSRALHTEVAGALLPIDATLLRRTTNTSAPKVERNSLGGGMCLATFHLLVSFAEYSIILVCYIIDFTDCWTVSYLAVGWVWILQSHLPKHRYVSIPGNWTLHKCFRVVLLYYFTLNAPQEISAEKKNIGHILCIYVISWLSWITHLYFLNSCHHKHWRLTQALIVRWAILLSKLLVCWLSDVGF